MKDRNGNIISYLVAFNETQRKGLLELLNYYKAAHGREPAELEFWIGMLQDLPTEEDKAPGIIHGFCL